MGRHAAPAPDGPDPARPDDQPSSGSPEATAPSAPGPTDHPTRPWWRETVVFAVAGAVASGSVLRWAVGEWWVAVLGAIGAAAVVVVATWVARSVPAPER